MGEHEVDFKTQFERIAIGSRVEIVDASSIITGHLESVEVDGVWIGWRFMEWTQLNQKSSEDIREKHQYIPFDQIKTFGWIK